LLRVLRSMSSPGVGWHAGLSAVATVGHIVGAAPPLAPIGSRILLPALAPRSSICLA
jgi:hypothetical protein